MKCKINMTLLAIASSFIITGCNRTPTIINEINIEDNKIEQTEVEQNVIDNNMNPQIVPIPVQSTKDNYYILPGSDQYYLTYSDISHLSKYELALARNEIFARHGYIFDTPDYRNYFLNQTWYNPYSKFSMSSLNKVEQHNIQFIKSYE